MLQTRVNYTVFVVRQSYQREMFSIVLKSSLYHNIIRWDAAKLAH